MIGKYEMSRAMEGHLYQMGNPPAVLEGLEIDEQILHSAAATMAKARLETVIQDDKPSIIYKGGFIDGFVMGVKAQIAEMFLTCQRCGAGEPRIKDGVDIPEDYDPSTTKILCDTCKMAVNASNN